MRLQLKVWLLSVHVSQTDTFHLEAIGLGELQKIVIGYEYGTMWSLDRVVIRESDDAKEEYLFTCDRYADTVYSCS